MLDEELRASTQDGTYPRPQLVRPRWLDLSGDWDFAYDDDVTVDPRAGIPAEFPRTIVVPFPPESPLSGINETGYHPVVWYRRRVELARASSTPTTPMGRTLLLHFGAVDYRADVWIGGVHVGSHEGGHTPFTVEVPGRRGGLRHRRAGRGRPARSQPAARQAGLEGRTALHLVPPHDRDLAAGLARVGAATARDPRRVASRHPERSGASDPRARRTTHGPRSRARHAPPW